MMDSNHHASPFSETLGTSDPTISLSHVICSAKSFLFSASNPPFSLSLEFFQWLSSSAPSLQLCKHQQFWMVCTILLATGSQNKMFQKLCLTSKNLTLICTSFSEFNCAKVSRKSTSFVSLSINAFWIEKESFKNWKYISVKYTSGFPQRLFNICL